MIKFEWDTTKATSNKKKHGVTFEEAQSVFYDEFAIQFFDENNSGSENRFLMLGFSDRARLLIVCHANKTRETLFESSQPEKPRKTKATIIKGSDDEN